jgi:hypothetical protein
MLKTKWLSYLSTNSFLESKCRSLNHKRTWFSNGCTLAVKVYQRKNFRDHNNTKLRRSCLSDQTSQTGMAKLAAPKLQKRKRYRSNQNSTSQTSSLPSTSHGECLMAKGKKKKKPTKVQSEEEKEEDEEVDDEYDFDFDKLSKKDIIKIKNLFEKVQLQELSLE